jgi:hypothetical protein
VRQLTPIELRKAAILKAYRSAIRLKHSLVADDEINATVPDVENRMNALSGSEILALNPGEAFYTTEDGRVQLRG